MGNKRIKLVALLLMALLVVGMCGCQTGESNDSASSPVVPAPPETKPDLFGGSGSDDSASPPVVPAPPETKPNLFRGNGSDSDAPVSHETAPPSGQAVTITAIDGHSMVKAADAALLLQLETYIDADDMVCFEQDGKAVKLAFDSPYVFQYQYRVDYLNSNSVRHDDEVYVPLSFISQYLSIDGEVRDDEYIATDVEAFDMYDVIKFLSEEIWAAYNDPAYPEREKVLAQVDKPRSLGIEVPNIDHPRWIMSYPLNDVQRDILIYNYGYGEDEIAGFTHEDYMVIEASQPLEPDTMARVKANYPALAEEDLTAWTYGELNDFYAQSDIKKEYLPAEKQQFAQRGLTEEDVDLLHKDFHGVDGILSQSDERLKEVITGYYRTWYDLIGECAEKYPHTA